jgi:hypothetical protein
MLKLTMNARTAAALAVIVTASAAVARAQVPTIPVGTHVRLEAPRPNVRIDGTVKWQSADSIAVETQNSVWTVSLASVRRIDVSGGLSHRDGAIRGMKIGALGLGGTIATLLVVAYLVDPNPDRGGADECINPGAAIPILAGAGAIVGGVAGLAIGGMVGAEHWDRVYLGYSATRPLGYSAEEPSRRAARFGLSLRF